MSMTAILRPIGMLKKYIEDKEEIEVQSGITVLDALISKKIPPELVAGVIVNGNYKYKDYLIQDQDIVQVIAVIGGG